MIFSRFSKNLSTKRMFSSCQYEPPFLARFGYMGAFTIGGMFSLLLRSDHQQLYDKMFKIENEIKEVKNLVSEKTKSEKK